LATPDLDVEVENNVIETNDFGNLSIQVMVMGMVMVMVMVMAKSQHISSDGSRGTFLNTQNK
jgi:uncharacterized protein YjfI (DUF2170 family)